MNERNQTKLDRTDEIYTVIDNITAMLMDMSKEERIAWFRKTQYPHPVNFNAEIDGTVYTVTTHFNKQRKLCLKKQSE